MYICCCHFLYSVSCSLLCHLYTLIAILYEFTKCLCAHAFDPSVLRQNAYTLMMSPGPGATSSHPAEAGHMNTSPTIGPFRGVVGTPCGHLDSSSNVTIFSRGLDIDIRLCGIMFVLFVVIGCSCGCGIKCGNMVRFGGGSARSPTPLKLNSLMLRGT